MSQIRASSRPNSTSAGPCRMNANRQSSSRAHCHRSKLFRHIAPVLFALLVRFAAAHPMSHAFRGPILVEKRLRAARLNRTEVFGGAKSTGFKDAALLVRVRGPLVEAPSVTHVVSWSPREILPSSSAEAETEAEPTPTEEVMPFTSFPSTAGDDFDTTPDVFAEAMETPPPLLSDEEEASQSSPELMKEPEPSSTFDAQEADLIPSPESPGDPDPSWNPLETPLPESGIPGDEQPPTSIPTVASPTLFPTASAEVVPESSDAGLTSTAGDSVLSSIEGLKDGADRVGVAVATFIGVLSILVVSVIGVVASTRARYIPFVVGGSLSENSNDNVVPPRARPDRVARDQDGETAPWRYQARSLDRFENGN